MNNAGRQPAVLEKWDSNSSERQWENHLNPTFLFQSLMSKKTHCFDRSKNLTEYVTKEQIKLILT